jgi:hypothetical protein
MSNKTHNNRQVTETFIPVRHHLFDSCRKGIGAQCSYASAHLCFYLIIKSEVFFWSDETEVSRFKVQAVWWMGKTLPAKLLQELSCDTDCMGMDFVMEKDHFFYEQAWAFHPDDFLHVSQCWAVAICTHCCPQWFKKSRRRMPYASSQHIAGFGMRSAFSSSFWTMGATVSTTNIAQDCDTWQTWSRWNALAWLQRKWSFSTITPAPIELVSQQNSCCSFAESVLPIHHTLWTLHLVTSLDHWRRTS